MPNLFVKNNKNINKEKINIEKAFPFSNINEINSHNLKDKRSKKYKNPRFRGEFQKDYRCVGNRSGKGL